MNRSGTPVLWFGGTWQRRLASFCSALFLGCACALPAQAAFLEGYSLHDFTLTNVDADGSAATPDGGLSVVITGGNTGTGLSGWTDLTIAALGSGILTFDYSYSSLDFPPYDWAGYLLGSSFVQLADSDGQSGTIAVPVSSGQIFGWRVATFDNIFEPGVLTLSGFSAPAGGAPIPEPGSWMLVLAGVAGAAAVRRWRNRYESTR